MNNTDCFKDNRLIEVICVFIVTFIVISLMIKYPYQADDDIESDIVENYNEIQNQSLRKTYHNCTIVIGNIYNKCIHEHNKYKNFTLNDSIRGEITIRPRYTVHMNDVVHISSKTNKPIVCGKTNYVRWQHPGYFLYTNIHETEGQYCNKNLEEYHIVYAKYDVTCCVDEYCATYYGGVYEYIVCECK